MRARRLRMVIGAFGVEVDEARLRALTDCTPLGTEAFQVVEAARRLGFTASRKHTLTSIEELDRLLGEGLVPSVRFPRVSYRKIIILQMNLSVELCYIFVCADISTRW